MAELKDIVAKLRNPYWRELVAERARIADAIEALQTQLAGATRDNAVPGSWVCDRCGFVEARSIMSAATGAVRAQPVADDPRCPNDGEALRSLTWRELAEARGARVRDLSQELEALTRWRESVEATLLAVEAERADAERRATQAADNFDRLANDLGQQLRRWAWLHHIGADLRFYLAGEGGHTTDTWEVVNRIGVTCHTLAVGPTPEEALDAAMQAYPLRSAPQVPGC